MKQDAPAERTVAPFFTGLESARSMNIFNIAKSIVTAHWQGQRPPARSFWLAFMLPQMQLPPGERKRPSRPMFDAR